MSLITQLLWIASFGILISDIRAENLTLELMNHADIKSSARCDDNDKILHHINKRLSPLSDTELYSYNILTIVLSMVIVTIAIVVFACIFCYDRQCCRNTRTSFRNFVHWINRRPHRSHPAGSAVTTEANNNRQPVIIQLHPHIELKGGLCPAADAISWQ